MRTLIFLAALLALGLSQREDRTGGQQPAGRTRGQQSSVDNNNDLGNTDYAGQDWRGPHWQGPGGYGPRGFGYRGRHGGYGPRQGGYGPRHGGHGPWHGGYGPRRGGYGPRMNGRGGYGPRWMEAMLSSNSNGNSRTTIRDDVDSWGPHRGHHMGHGHHHGYHHGHHHRSGMMCPTYCPNFESPVCGSDGISYTNMCTMRMEACRNGTTVTVARLGRC